MKARLPKGMGGGPSNMQSVIRQAQKMQEEMEVLQTELDAREYDISAGGGVVKVKIMGTLEVKSIEINPEVIDPEDPETLSDLLVAAMNEAITKVNETNEAAKEKITGNLNIPGMF